MSSVAATAAPITPRTSGNYVISGAVEGLKMESKWGAIVGAPVGAVAGLAIGGRAGGAGAVAGLLGGAAAGAAIGALSLVVAGTAHGLGAGIANAIGKPETADDLHTNSVIGGAVAGMGIGALGGTRGPQALLAGVVIGGLWGGLMGHFISGRID